MKTSIAIMNKYIILLNFFEPFNEFEKERKANKSYGN